MGPQKAMMWLRVQPVSYDTVFDGPGGPSYVRFLQRWGSPAAIAFSRLPIVRGLGVALTGAFPVKRHGASGASSLRHGACRCRILPVRTGRSHLPDFFL